MILLRDEIPAKSKITKKNGRFLPETGKEAIPKETIPRILTGNFPKNAFRGRKTGNGSPGGNGSLAATVTTTATKAAAASSTAKTATAKAATVLSNAGSARTRTLPSRVAVMWSPSLKF